MGAGVDRVSDGVGAAVDRVSDGVGAGVGEEDSPEEPATRAVVAQ